MLSDQIGIVKARHLKIASHHARLRPRKRTDWRNAGSPAEETCFAVLIEDAKEVIAAVREERGRDAEPGGAIEDFVEDCQGYTLRKGWRTGLDELDMTA